MECVPCSFGEKMAILRPLGEIAAQQARATIDFMYDALYEVAHDDNPRFFPAVRIPEESPIFVPCREGRSLYSFVKRRSFRKRSHAGRLSGHNHGKDVTYYDEL